MRAIKVFMTMMLFPVAGFAQTTFEQCQEAARKNYPLVRKYDLINKTTALTVSNITKRSWLPQIESYGQGTMQSSVATLPDMLTNMVSQMGYNDIGLGKIQYRIGVNVSQNIYDGGSTNAQKAVTQIQGQVQVAQTDVELYQLRKRVSELFFGILLIDERIQLSEDLHTLLRSNEELLANMLKGGVAMECDYNSVKAERISVKRQLMELQMTKRQLQQLLSVFVGWQVGELQKPNPSNDSSYSNNRPELQLINIQLLLANAQERQVKSRLLPQIGVFAQGYYGYPGYDMFHDMFHRNPTLNGIVGLKLSWNVSNIFTFKNDLTKVRVQREIVENQREMFLFNSQLEQVAQSEEIEKYRRLMEEDVEIVDLRAKVRISHESKLRHGIINVADLLAEITKESQAKTEFSIHEIQWLKAIYDLKYIVND